jgi:glycosyltransferase 2 family protein
MASRPPGMTAGWRRARPLVGAAIGLIFVVLLLERVDWRVVGSLLAGATAGPLLLALAALATGIGLRLVRWWWMLRALEPRLPLTRCVRPFLGSLALNNTLPLRAGDVVRVVGFRGTLRSPPARVLATLVLERLLDMLVLLLVFFAALAGTARVFPRGFLVAAVVTGTTAAASLLVLIAAPDLVARLAERLVGGEARRPFVTRLAPIVRQLVVSLRVLGSARRAAVLLLITLLAWLAEGAVFAATALALGVSFPWPAPWLSLGAATLSTLLPGAPGYVGTFDWFATLGFVAYGTERSAAAAVALLVHLLLWLPVTAAGLALLGFRRSDTAPVEASGV